MFMLCEDFREEGGGKLSIYGVIGDNIQVDLPDTQSKVAFPSLGLIMIFRDGVGKFQMSNRLTFPNKQALPTSEMKQSVEKRSDGWMNVAIKLMPFHGQIGEYNLGISLIDEHSVKKDYTRAFSITRRPQTTKH